MRKNIRYKTHKNYNCNSSISITYVSVSKASLAQATEAQTSESLLGCPKFQTLPKTELE